MISLDLGQSGARVRVDGKLHISSRAHRPGDRPRDSIVEIFRELPGVRSDVVSLSLSGFNGVIKDEIETAQVCRDAVGAQHVAIIDDGLAGYFGTQRGTDGVTLLIGGGVVSIGAFKNSFTHRDGLGHLFGDEGGGFWVGAHAITRALASRQGRDHHHDLVTALAPVLAEFDALEIKNGSDASRLAVTSAKLVLELADQGIPAALAIREEGARLLARTIIASWLGTGGSADQSPSVVIYGGLSKNASYKNLIMKNVLAELPHAYMSEPQGDNLDGAEYIAAHISENIEPLLKWVHF